jgi:hypothetical protein
MPIKQGLEFFSLEALKAMDLDGLQQKCHQAVRDITIKMIDPDTAGSCHSLDLDAAIKRAQYANTLIERRNMLESQQHEE